MVFGHRAAIKSIELLKNDNFQLDKIAQVPEWNDEGLKMTQEMVLLNYLKKQLQILMSDLVSIVRTNERLDRKSTRLNSSHVAISYAVFCLKKKNKRDTVV